jgi:hypothetical protein
MNAINTNVSNIDQLKLDSVSASAGFAGGEQNG